MSKPYSLTFEHRASYLYVGLECSEYDSEIIYQYWQEIIEESERTGIDNIMVEVKVTADLNFTDALQSIGYFKPKPRRRIAYVGAPPEMKNIYLFAIDVSASRGFNVELFDNIEAAEKWLLETD